MRPALLLGRLVPARGSCKALTAVPVRQRCFSRLQPVRELFRAKARPGRRSSRILLCAALSPAAFLKISEEEHDDGKTAEKQMLEASRAEIKEELPKDEHGLRRLLDTFVFVWDQYIYEPIATGFRFLHLVVIFVPVIVTIPAVWVGRRRKDKDNERTGTLWWYGFLVTSMERAGPAFIKVNGFLHGATSQADKV